MFFCKSYIKNCLYNYVPTCERKRSDRCDASWWQERCELSFFTWGLWEVSSRHAGRTWKHAGHDAVAGRVGVAMVISWGGHSPSLTLTEKIMLPACLSTDVATNHRDIRSSSNKANVHACTKVYETDLVFESRDYEATNHPTIRSCLTYSVHRTFWKLF